MGWLQKLASGLSKTSNKLRDGMRNLFSKGTLDEVALEELEELLIKTDMGLDVVAKISDSIRSKDFSKSENATDEVKNLIVAQISSILKPLAIPMQHKDTLHIILLCGVNGNGKTTTAAKIAKDKISEGKKVMMVACDTFRAAAVEQLKAWGEKIKCHVEHGKDKEDPASVSYKAIKKAQEEHYDVVIIDTAGRMHNNVDLMQQLAKIYRTIDKIDHHFPHDTILVLDATVGQNTFAQIEEFKKYLLITGIIMTKLDGTAKGGILISLGQRYQLPIHAIGVGESSDDLQEFDACAFAKSLIY